MKKKPVLKFTVKLSQWRCGGEGRFRLGQGNTLLLSKSGRKCCLGFACLAAGAKRIFRFTDPEETDTILPGLTGEDKNGHIRNTAFSTAAIGINDDPDLTLSERKKRLKALGAKHNIQIKFVK